MANAIVGSGLGVMALRRPWFDRGFSGFGVRDLRPWLKIWAELVQNESLVAFVMVFGAVVASTGSPSGEANNNRRGWYLPLLHFSTT